MKETRKKIAVVLKKIFGWSIMICLFAGGLTFFGYLAALIIGGDTAAAICEFIYKKFIPVIIYTSNITILLGLVSLYIAGEKALTTSAKKKTVHKDEGER